VVARSASRINDDSLDEKRARERGRKVLRDRYISPTLIGLLALLSYASRLEVGEKADLAGEA